MMQPSVTAPVERPSRCKKCLDKVFNENIAAPHVRAKNLVDMYTMLDDVPDQPEVLVPDTPRSQDGVNLFERISKLSMKPLFWTMLVVLAVATALLANYMDVTIDALGGFRDRLVLDRAPHMAVSLLYCLVYVICCGCFATFSTDVISKEASGSGIPEMKTILTGVNIPNFFSCRTFLAKTSGLVAALAGGLSVGKEGPFVHIAAIIAYNLSRIPIFSRHVDTTSRQNKVLQVAVAVGLTATFGTPVGGVLFAIECCATFFMIDGLWKAYFACFFTILTFKTLHEFTEIELFEVTDLPKFSLTVELISFAVLGVVCGAAGGFFVWWCSKTYTFGKHVQTSRRRKYLYTCSVMLFSTLVQFAAPFLGNQDRRQINEMFSNKGISDEMSILGSEFFTMLVFVIYKNVLTALSLACPVPCGSFVPTFVLGAGLGRLYGNIVNLFIPGCSPPSAYAVVGAAAFTAGVVRVLSISVIVFELTGDMKAMMPVLLAVLMAYATNAALSLSLYDMIIRFKQMPYLPKLQNLRTYRQTAADIMFNADAFTLPEKDSTYEDLLFCKVACLSASIPVVVSRENPVFLGSVSCTDAEEAVVPFQIDKKGGGGTGSGGSDSSGACACWRHPRVVDFAHRWLPRSTAVWLTGNAPGDAFGSSTGAPTPGGSSTAATRPKRRLPGPPRLGKGKAKKEGYLRPKPPKSRVQSPSRQGRYAVVSMPAATPIGASSDDKLGEESVKGNSPETAKEAPSSSSGREMAPESEKRGTRSPEGPLPMRGEEGGEGEGNGRWGKARMSVDSIQSADSLQHASSIPLWERSGSPLYCRWSSAGSDRPSHSPSGRHASRLAMQTEELVNMLETAALQYDIAGMKEVDLDVRGLRLDWTPLTIHPETPVSRIHFLFTMLSLSQLFVCDPREGTLLGVVTKESFFDPNKGLGVFTPEDQPPPVAVDYEELRRQVEARRLKAENIRSGATSPGSEQGGMSDGEMPTVRGREDRKGGIELTDLHAQRSAKEREENDLEKAAPPSSLAKKGQGARQASSVSFHSDTGMGPVGVIAQIPPPVSYTTTTIGHPSAAGGRTPETETIGAPVWMRGERETGEPWMGVGARGQVGGGGGGGGFDPGEIVGGGGESPLVSVGTRDRIDEQQQEGSFLHDEQAPSFV
uniref:Chloride channel protein n=1 Tax=Chromera velia CCMP2878 TaxID=1169474 RepID=A0A0G4HDE0_9ALVE|eukprot:Cvel_26342.t1-p1 / transcript=Cvel_26342.t1 / gene=Cvel_26342 / organism=Chromera_velia_CCMP2878 / gene_product=Chloride channel protein 2, putative / transcript_product=Chloride channel protein 2, putative / location=Cvel_scaffold3118:6965-19221(-) / protein_length=1149 / sequence_SO=supercontig / SO=protein_coding / is_pseudo=false